jgi:Chemotaxis protein histidine kinase and related kinases
MNNGMESMLDMFLFETNTLLEQLEEIMLESEKEKSFSTDSINEIFRIMHTIKGSSAMMEFDSLAKLAHRIEDLFFIFRENNCVESFSEELRTELFNLMFRSNDFMRSQTEKIENNEVLSDNIDQFITDINTFIEKMKGNPVETVETIVETPISDLKPKDINNDLPESDAAYLIQIFFDDGCGMEHLRAFMIKTAVKEVIGEDFTCIPADIEENSETCNYIIDHGFFLCIQKEEFVEKVVQVLKEALNVASFEVILNPNVKKATIKTEKVEETEVKEEIPQNTASGDNAQKAVSKAPNHQTQTKQSIISVNLSKLDSLMAIVGEIVITESMVTASPELKGLKLDNFTKSARQLRKLTDELQDITMSIRMIPVSGVFNKMNRIVRDMCQKTNKDVRLTIIGENTELDKTIVDSINDPLMHIVRNAMDHGIEEDVQDRINLGKDTQGEIILEAEHTGSDVIITITDDGTGVDTTKVLAKAKKNGLLTKPESEYSKREILNLLLAPGFSTNEVVTEYSGRGVGMDVVKQNIEKVGGVISISSELGEGTCISLKIPLTMAIVDGMDVAVGNSIFTIPITHIRQSFKVSKEDVILDSMGNEIVERMGDFYPIVRLHNLYNISTQVVDVEDGIFVWVESSDKSYCLFVDDLIGKQQVVVKPLPAYLNSFNIKDAGIAGCTILGDGNISIILDILNLHVASMYAF